MRRAQAEDDNGNYESQTNQALLSNTVNLERHMVKREGAHVHGVHMVPSGEGGTHGSQLDG